MELTKSSSCLFGSLDTYRRLYSFDVITAFLRPIFTLRVTIFILTGRYILFSTVSSGLFPKLGMSEKPGPLKPTIPFVVKFTTYLFTMKLLCSLKRFHGTCSLTTPYSRLNLYWCLFLLSYWALKSYVTAGRNWTRSFFINIKASDEFVAVEPYTNLCKISEKVCVYFFLWLSSVHKRLEL